MDSSLVNKVKNSFTKAFGQTPELVFSPGRINLIGEHVDYNDGFVFPAAIDKGIAVAVQKAASASETHCNVVAQDFEEAYRFTLSEFVPIEGGGWRNYLIGVLAGLKEHGCKITPFNMMFSGNVPSGAGLSSSAALENGIVYSLNHLFGFGLNKSQMIAISQKAEHCFVGVKCGIMDQYASMFGIADHFLLLDCRAVTAQPIKIDLSGYELLLINSNVQHNLSDSVYNKRRALCEKAVEILGKKALRDVSLQELEVLKEKGFCESDYQKVRYVVEEIARTQQAAELIAQNNMEGLGELLYHTHWGLSSKYQVSCEELDYLVGLAEADDAVIGSRMMGGGFGGCTINIIKAGHSDRFQKETQIAFKKKFGYQCSPIRIELSDGTHLINQNI